MPSIVETVFDSGNGRALELNSCEISRPLSFGNNWNELALVFTGQISSATDVSALSLFYYSPTLHMGLTTSGSQFLTGNIQHALYGGFINSGVLLDNVTATQIRSGASDDRNARIVAFQTGSLLSETTQTGADVGISLELTSSSYRSSMGVYFRRYTTNDSIYVYSFIPDYGGPAYDAVESGAMQDALTSGNYSAFLKFLDVGGAGLATPDPVDEATFGPLDTLSFVWPIATHTLQIHNIFAAKWS